MANLFWLVTFIATIVLCSGEFRRVVQFQRPGRQEELPNLENGSSLESIINKTIDAFIAINKTSDENNTLLPDIDPVTGYPIDNVNLLKETNVLNGDTNDVIEAELDTIDINRRRKATFNGRRRVPFSKPSRSSKRQSPFFPPVPPVYEPMNSPWLTTPGTYNPSAYSGPLSAEYLPYSSDQVYASYLSSPPLINQGYSCKRQPYGPPRDIKSLNINEREIQAAIEFGRRLVEKDRNIDLEHFKNGNYIDMKKSSTAARHQMMAALHKEINDEDDNTLEYESYAMEYAARYLVSRFCLSKLEAMTILPKLSLSVQLSKETCLKRPTLKNCGDIHVRANDGRCNNLEHPFWGKAATCHTRLMPAAYEDGVGSPRIHSVTGELLPNVRLVSLVAHPSATEGTYYTHYKMLWGQYVNHDLTDTPTASAEHGGGIKCCPHGNHTNCLPITLIKGDYQTYITGNKTCINFVRSAGCSLCTLGTRQQSNLVTSFLDNSALYGSSDQVLKSLRTGFGGQLRTSRDIFGKHIIPPTKKSRSQCQPCRENVKCFEAGDGRVNQHPGLMALHVQWLRRHNMHAAGFQHVNPHWSDERLFQEARKATIADHQHITYSEYLPIILGPEILNYFQLNARHEGYSNYDPQVNPQSLNEFIVAASRFGHSQIQSFFRLFKGRMSSIPPNHSDGFFLRDKFFDPCLIIDGRIDEIVQGAIIDQAGVVDPYVSEDIKNHLYQTKDKKIGSDLIAVNLQRGRDHAAPPYYAVVEFCFGVKVQSWQDLTLFIPEKQVEIMKTLYKDWRDIDLYSAGLSERKVADGIVGPTFACIIGIQFNHIKFGDRFFYSHGPGGGHAFNRAQLDDIRKTATLAAFVCQTSDSIEMVPKYPFLPISEYNPLVNCRSLPVMNHELYRETPPVPKPVPYRPSRP